MWHEEEQRDWKNLVINGDLKKNTKTKENEDK